MLKVEATYPVIGGLRVLNERECIDHAGRQLSTVVRARARAGRGPDGPLPKNHQGHTPWNDTGRTAAAIGHVLKQDSKGRWSAVVRPLGKLVDRDVKAIVARAKEKTRALRAAEALGPPIQLRGASGKFQTGAKKRRKIQVRPVDTYAAVAAVLSVRDKRPGSTRAIYRVMAASASEQTGAVRVMQGMVKTELVEGTNK